MSGFGDPRLPDRWAIPVLPRGRDHVFRAGPAAPDVQEWVRRLGPVDEGDSALHRAGDSAVSAAAASSVAARFDELLEAAARSGPS
jgi:hypothetical protein